MARATIVATVSETVTAKATVTGEAVTVATVT